MFEVSMHMVYGNPIVPPMSPKFVVYVPSATHGVNVSQIFFGYYCWQVDHGGVCRCCNCWQHISYAWLHGVETSLGQKVRGKMPKYQTMT